MKTLFRICLFCFVLLLLVAVGGYFLLTNAGFQKRMVEARLPAGSSLKSVHVTTSTLELSELILVLPDGTRVKVGEVATSFSPMAALFNKTIKMGALKIDGLLVTLPAAAVASSGEVASRDSQGSEVSKSEKATREPSPVAQSNPWEAINQIGNLEWLLDIETIQLDGQLKDAAGASYVFDVKSGAIRPAVETVLDASLTLVSAEALSSGLQAFDSKSQLRFKQKASGGFEALHLQSKTVGNDVGGRQILSIDNVVDLNFNAFEETADVQVQLSADIQRPEMFLPELSSMGALLVEANGTARVDGAIMTLNKAAMTLAAKGQQVVELDLKKALNLGGKQNLSGELLVLKLTDLPMEWLGPWLPEGLFLEGAPLSAQLNVTGQSDGAMELRALAPLRVGPLTVRQGEALLLQEATLVVDPVVRVNSDQSITYEVKNFQMMDRYGEVISGQASGSAVKVADAAGNPFAGQQANVKLKLGLQELFQQPMLKDRASILAGTMTLNVTVDGRKEYPLIAQGGISGLRPSSAPGQVKDYRFASQLKSTGADVWALGLNFEAGSVERPSTSLQLAGQANAKATPLTFKVDLTGAQITQSDLTVLAAAFTPKESNVVTAPTPSTPVRAGSSSGAPRPATVPVAETPAWAGYQGEASLKLDRVLLDSGQTIRELSGQAIVSEPLLQLKGLQAALGEGRLNGSGEVRYARTQANAYAVLADFSFDQIDPSIFSQKSSGSFPVKGLFDGKFKLTGAGPDLATAVESSVGDLTITGRDGVLTAFELDNRSQLGLLGVGLLGQSLNRPGVTAMAETVPYFKDIRFSSFVLELKRGTDKRIMIPQLKLLGDNLLIDGTGFIAASSFKDVLDQPLQLGMELGAKGQLTNYLETLNLLKPTTAEDGFRRWNQKVNLSGTLGKPNSDELMDLLKRAASAAIAKPSASTASPQAATGTADAAKTEAAPQSEKEKTKAEKRRDDIEMGLDLLNTVLGN